ncbi:MAG: glutamate synthase large subunit [Muribaculaceae bacterium]|nr:glutamate synthase large subunit [Muribaculaceae bacterium]
MAMYPDVHACGSGSHPGLYSPEYEHDGCGVGLVVKIDGSKHHSIVDQGLKVLEHMAHRGAEGADNKSGDGAGIMVQIPHEYILLNGIPVPEKGRYGVGMVFLPKQEDDRRAFEEIIDREIKAQGLFLMHTRDVPVDSSVLGNDALATEPLVRQYFIVGCDNRERLEGLLYVIRKRVEQAVLDSDLIADKDSCYIVSLSTRTLVYKGMLSSLQLRAYYKDLQSPYFTSAIALVHSRFSTNTFPTWRLAQPFRLIGHNGEINTIRGNRFWMSTREAVIEPENLGEMKRIGQVIQPGMSDSASFDNALEFFVRSGLSLPHALAMLVPESCNEQNPLSRKLLAFYEYHSIFMAPWDGPAAIIFSDGRYAGGMLDRNGLRPARVVVTRNGEMIIASETGVLDVPAEEIDHKSRLKPGKILMVDTEKGEIIIDRDIKNQLALEHPYSEWIDQNRIILNDIRSGRKVSHEVDDMDRRLTAFGYNQEDISLIIKPMASAGQEPTSAMGNDAPPAVLSQKPQRFFNYFRQQFAQVTNPPIDPIREELVMSLTSYVGSVAKNILQPSAELCKVVKMSSPIVSDSELDKLRHLQYKGFRTLTIPILFDASGGVGALEAALESICSQAEDAVDKGYNYMVLSDRNVNSRHAPIPSLLALSAVHHHLVSRRKRSQIAIIVESGEICEVMHVALLMGYGASAVNPYMAFAILKRLVDNKEIQLDFEGAESHYIKAINKGILKIMSKMGISTIRSYRGCALFEALGVSSRLLARYMGGGTSSVEGIGIEDVAREALQKHEQAYGSAEAPTLADQGNYRYRKDGELHAWNPAVVKALQEATKGSDYEKFEHYVSLVEEKESPIFLRDIIEVKSDRQPIPLEEVEREESIMRRFCTEAMSFGAISKEAHEAIAIAMNKIGGMSNTGEGGEDPERNKVRPDGTLARSSVKQVASGRFGVDAEYLVNADEIQIKVAQGAKPGEGGQLPGFKVDEVIARTRHSLPGITLISPPPHHDIYSIEDLAQLIFDLKNLNPSAQVSVKLVAESGVGTIAAGVTKAKADKILISGCDGGTGASPASSMKHAGVPAEIGLAEIQQTLVMNNLRGKVRLQVDGQLKSPHDVMVSALLGAEEFGFGTAPLVVLGCCMARVCHTNTCPKGVATQNPELRRKFAGRYEYLINYYTFMARSIRHRLAAMGYRSIDEIVGRADLLVKKDTQPDTKASKLDFSRLFFMPSAPGEGNLHFVSPQDHKLEGVKDEALLQLLKSSIDSRQPLALGMPIVNTDRSVGAMLSGYVAKRFGATGLPADSIRLTFTGSAGQSFGAFLCPGITLRLEGDANDYLGKGLCGGKITVIPPRDSTFLPEANTIAGNTLLYGATSGELYVNGRVGERFAVRNSGAVAVVEGVGDHACEYMTGGRVAVLGKIGRNFAAGMSGGIAYIWNVAGNADCYINMDLVELTLVEEPADREELHSLIEAHYQHTRSQLARRMLDDWDTYAPQFLKVTPVEYKRYL